MLEEYYSFCIRDGVITEIPVILDGVVVPDIRNLPELLVLIAEEVDWADEKKCLGKISMLLAWFYSRVPDIWEGMTWEEHYKNSIFPFLIGRL